jgi:subtilisin family serine protease
MPDGAYIFLPLPPRSEMDQQGADAAEPVQRADRTAADDGWGVFSGTSAAAPQVAGVCALMLEANRR